MPKQPANKQNKPTLKDFLDSYDAVTLNSALGTFEASLGWQLLKAYAGFVQRTYEIAALDKLPRQDETLAASYAAGYAKACEDLSGFHEGLKKTILGKGDAYEVPRPEE